MTRRRDVERMSRRLWRLCCADGSVDEARVRQVVEAVVMAKRGSGRAILVDLARRLRLDGARRAARVVTATPIAADARDAIAARIVRRFGPCITPTFVVDQALIGGMRVEIGSHVWDGSIRASLAALDTTLAARG